MPSLNQLLCPDPMENPRKSADNNFDTETSEAYVKTKSRRCSFPACQKTAKRGGRCISHGGGNKCTKVGCTTSVVSRGLCVAHGGGKRCQTHGCSKSAQSGGFCWVHGGGKKCGYQGCSKRAQSGGACIAHGGGKRCRIDMCNKVVQYDGLCVGHGGFRRCAEEKCNRRAMANNYCQQHGGSSICLLQHCCKRAVRGGLCSLHKTKTLVPSPTSRQVPSKDQWHDRLNVDERVMSFSSEPRASCGTETVMIRSPSPVRSIAQMTRADASRALGYSALLNTDIQLPHLKSLHSTRPSLLAQHSSLNHEKQHRQPPNVMPLLPSIHVLQDYQRRVSFTEKPLYITQGLTNLSPSISSDFQHMILQDRYKHSYPTMMDNQEGYNAHNYYA
ncbi:hypothetical protein CCR75_007558 [Bremia lactucae]|uniref:WRKY19-like zinc finger domain-containing protein n=1 Tax=Bremia lactucae TaxID=4779 RepID=A0A976P0F6_BRELC|nr:hypothetical protein CCR75_007558 [Bremia lactucae]